MCKTGIRFWKGGGDGHLLAPRLLAPCSSCQVTKACEHAILPFFTLIKGHRLVPFQTCFPCGARGFGAHGLPSRLDLVLDADRPSGGIPARLERWLRYGSFRARLLSLPRDLRLQETPRDGAERAIQVRLAGRLHLLPFRHGGGSGELGTVRLFDIMLAVEPDQFRARLFRQHFPA